MSVTFFVVGLPPHCADENSECTACWSQSVNVTNVNARTLLGLLGLDAGEALLGQVRARDLRLRIQVVETLKLTTSVAALVEERLVSFGRDEAYFQERLVHLATLCTYAGDLGVIAWG